MSFAGLQWPDLVHDRVVDVEEKSRHEHLIVTRLVLGAIGLACFPPYLAWHGAPGWLDALLALSLAGPIFAAALLSLTGQFLIASTISAVASAGLVACLALSSGNLAWPVLIWLLIEPLDALLGGARRAAVLAGLSSLAASLLIVAFVASGVGPAAAPWLSQIAVAFLSGTALVQLGSQTLRHRRLGGFRQAAPSMRDTAESALLDVVGDLVTWHGRAGEVLKASGSALRFMGVPSASLQGQGLLRHVHVSDRPIFLRALSDAANADEPVTAAFRLHVGAEFHRLAPVVGDEAVRSRVTWVEMRARKVDGQGSGFAVVSVIRDTTALRQHAEELEKARADAERADQLKGRFLATVTHELRTPLNAIIGFSELLTAEHPYVMTEERRTEYATIIRDSGHHLLGVVNTLLDMSKIETGNFNFEPETFSLAELVDGSCDLLQLRADQAGIVLERQIARDLPEVMADRRACRQILINLLSNAVKFTPKDGRVTIAVYRDRDRLVLSVADTGIGIGEGDLPHLGDPFFQAGDAYRRPHDGTGLGLSVVRGLVGLHDGTLTIESGAGIGTTVTVTLPLAGCGAEPDRRPVTVRTMVRLAAGADTRDRMSA